MNPSLPPNKKAPTSGLFIWPTGRALREPSGSTSGVQLKVIATELITQVRKSATIDWTLRESARAKIRVMVKRILNKYGYPPDLQEEAVKTVLMQAELLCADWGQV